MNTPATSSTMKWIQIAAVVCGVGLGPGCVQERVEYRPAFPQSTYASPPAPAPDPVPIVILRSAAELDRMLAPLALYPDPLLAQILPATTVPQEITEANRYVRQGGDLGQVDYEPWQQSVKALARYPDVLGTLAGNLAWTKDLGVAFVNQPGDVMDSIQRLRAQARAAGNLQSTPEQVVIIESSTIQIVPANPRVIYVPVYWPEIVYVQRPIAPNRLHLHFGSGRPTGSWLNHDLDWREREVIVWHREHPRPRNWWYEPPSRHARPRSADNSSTIRDSNRSQDFTVWRPENRNENRQWNRDEERGQNTPESRPVQNGGAQPRPGSRDGRAILTPKSEQEPPPHVTRDSRPSRPARNVPITPLPGDERQGQPLVLPGTAGNQGSPTNRGVPPGQLPREQQTTGPIGTIDPQTGTQPGTVRTTPSAPDRRQQPDQALQRTNNPPPSSARDLPHRGSRPTPVPGTRDARTRTPHSNLRVTPLPPDRSGESGIAVPGREGQASPAPTEPSQGQQPRNAQDAPTPNQTLPPRELQTNPNPVITTPPQSRERVNVPPARPGQRVVAPTDERSRATTNNVRNRTGQNVKKATPAKEPKGKKSSNPSPQTNQVDRASSK